jgi:hypothetical protein
MASIEYSVEIGAWVESDTPKKKRDGKDMGMRKVWVAGDAGAESRLSVIARVEGKADRHLVTLPVGDADARDIAAHVLTLALQGVQAYAEAYAKPAPKPAPAAPKPAPKAPTTAAVAKARAALGKPAPTPRVAPAAPAPASGSAYNAQDWAALLG